MFSHLHKYHNETKYFEPKCAVFSKNAIFCIRSRDNGHALVTSQSEPTGHLVASHAGVFRGARFSSLPTNACSTEDNIPFPCLANHIVLSKFWKVDLDRKVI